MDRFVKWIAKLGATGGIARSQYSLYKKTKKKNPDLKESDIAPHIFEHRFSRLGPTRKERQRLEQYLSVSPVPNTLREVCHAIAEIELNLNPLDLEMYSFAMKVIDEELNRLGYLEDDLLDKHNELIKKLKEIDAPDDRDS